MGQLWMEPALGTGEGAEAEREGRPLKSRRQDVSVRCGEWVSQVESEVIADDARARVEPQALSGCISQDRCCHAAEISSPVFVPGLVSSILQIP